MQKRTVYFPVFDMRILFITHDVGVYGAAQSLGLLIKALLDNGFVAKEEIFILYSKSFIKKQIVKSKIINDIVNKKTVLLPISGVYKGYCESPLKNLKNKLRNIVALFSSFITIRKQIKECVPDIVHLNSITLWPLLLVIPEKHKTIIHVREIFNHKTNKVVKYLFKKALSRAYRIIAIDKMARNSLEEITDKVEILNNPFDMGKARISREEYYKDLKKNADGNMHKKIIALIGRIQPIKGHMFFLDLADAFLDKEGTVFWIIGSSKRSEYSSLVTERAKITRNVKILGESEDMDVIYPMIDVVVRCEEYLPLGRTVFEGYYAGCSVLIPAGENDDTSEVEPFLNKGIWTYKPQNIVDLIGKVELIIQENSTLLHNRPTGNMKQYAHKFMTIINP